MNVALLVEERWVGNFIKPEMSVNLYLHNTSCIFFQNQHTPAVNSKFDWDLTSSSTKCPLEYWATIWSMVTISQHAATLCIFDAPAIKRTYAVRFSGLVYLFGVKITIHTVVNGVTDYLLWFWADSNAFSGLIWYMID